MVMTDRQPLEKYLARKYPLSVVAEPDGGYVVLFPDLPGCMTEVERLADVGPAAEEIRTLWIETAYERGQEIPPPTFPEEYSGRFNLRVPRSLHRTLVEGAERDGVSLNQYVTALLARRDADATLDHRLARLEAQVESLFHHVAFSTNGSGEPS
jgi:predicted RNase H-like HicB family nuclease